MFGACDGVGRHADDFRRQKSRELFANAAFDRADIADNGAGSESGCDRFQQIGVGAERGGENEQVGGVRGIFEGGCDPTVRIQ